MLGDDTFITYITSSMRIVFILFFFVQPLHIGQVSRAIIVARKTFSHTHMMWPIFFHIVNRNRFDGFAKIWMIFIRFAPDQIAQFGASGGFVC